MGPTRRPSCSGRGRCSSSRSPWASGSTGRWATAEDHLAHPYIDTAHRAALLYSFATLLVATFVQFSAWSDAVNLISAGVLYFFGEIGAFSILIAGFVDGQIL